MIESKDTDSKFLLEAARYFESRPTNGEDKAHWSNVYNAENCRRIAAYLTHPEAQGNKDLGEPAASGLEEESQYRKKPVVVKASQWFKNGDHPCDGDASKEGAVVRYYRHPSVTGYKLCKHCKLTMHEHGWIDTLESGHIVCPGDWIITGVQGERYPCKPDIFKATYELVLQGASAPAPTLLIKGESELESASNGMGLR